MDEILQFILNNASFLYKEKGCRFVDSEYSPSFGGNAVLVLASARLRLRIIRDRSQIFADFQETTGTNDGEWVSIDIVRKLLTGEPGYQAELNAENAVFLRDHFHEIESLFDSGSIVDSRKKFHKLEAKRAKYLFGKN